MSDSPQPWWTRVSHVSLKGACDAEVCKFRTLVSTECKIEADERGNPQRKCQRTFRKFKECPGRPVEVVETVEELTTEPSLSGDVNLWNGLSGSEKGSNDVLSSEMGQLLEEALAAFGSGFFVEGESMHAGEYPVDWPPDGKSMDDKSGRINEGLFSRFFRKRPRPPPPTSGGPNAQVYGEYASDFQEV